MIDSDHVFHQSINAQENCVTQDSKPVHSSYKVRNYSLVLVGCRQCFLTWGKRLSSNEFLHNSTASSGLRRFPHDLFSCFPVRDALRMSHGKLKLSALFGSQSAATVTRTSSLLGTASPRTPLRTLMQRSTWLLRAGITSLSSSSSLSSLLQFINSSKSPKVVTCEI